MTELDSGRPKRTRHARNVVSCQGYSETSSRTVGVPVGIIVDPLSWADTPSVLEGYACPLVSDPQSVV